MARAFRGRAHAPDESRGESWKAADLDARAGAYPGGKLRGAVRGEVARDQTLAAKDRLADRWGRNDVSIEGQALEVSLSGTEGTTLRWSFAADRAVIDGPRD
jgi:hypothetical protein